MYAEYSKIVKFSELADPSDHWDLLDRIGEGTYGEVYMAKHKVRGRLTSYIVACWVGRVARVSWSDHWDLLDRI